MYNYYTLYYIYMKLEIAQVTDLWKFYFTGSNLEHWWRHEEIIFEIC